MGKPLFVTHIIQCPALLLSVSSFPFCVCKSCPYAGTIAIGNMMTKVTTTEVCCQSNAWVSPTWTKGKLDATRA